MVVVVDAVVVVVAAGVVVVPKSWLDKIYAKSTRESSVP